MQILSLKNFITNFGQREIKITSIVFLASIITGIFLSFFLGETRVQEIIDSVFADLVTEFQNKDLLSLIISIFEHNLIAAAIIIGLGVIYKFLPTLVIFSNGMLLGLVLSSSVIYLGTRLDEILLMLIPHGIFEIPAIILEGALGFKLSRIAKTNNFVGRIKALLNSQKELTLIITLLLLAAIIEGSMIIFWAKDY